ncbi:DUF5685 family protein [Streptomyces laculatispora]|uniref:DUF5685 family protein n=1 Tax=Streptomyces laculatispora TaxID=887464 RepID=A0ABY9IAK2_9ACTN|nr:DUF5685 family protein [Streptomyces laculatispora]WLQ43912.1 DUF5685 family protein [Streptomyces laculatispora]
MHGAHSPERGARLNGTRGIVVFGIVRPCTHRLSEGLKAEWMAHLCGLCLALRSDHGQFARIVTNYDGLIVSVLTEAQTDRTPAQRRTAGPCPLRAMRTAPVARGEGARLAAAVSLVLASAKVRDHVADRDGLLKRRPVAAAARRVAAGWDRAGARTGAQLGFDTALLVDAVDRQTGIELLAGPGTPLLTVTEPTETATAAAFAHTAVLAGKPRNAEPLAEAGRLFGRLAHLLDAVEDQQADAASGAWNPLTATGTSRTEARRLCDDALRGVRLALRDAEFTDGRLAHVLLAHELRRSVDRAFATGVCSHQPEGPLTEGLTGPGGAGHPSGGRHTGAFGPPPGNPYAPSGPGAPFGPPQPPPKPPRDRRGLIVGCLVWAGLACTCQMCCGTFDDPWSRQRREGLCSRCDCGDCCDGCDCCSNCGDCCDGCDCCDCGCDCGC